jgi:transposase
MWASTCESRTDLKWRSRWGGRPPTRTRAISASALVAEFVAVGAGCRALMGLFGFGEVTALAVLTELGDASRLSRSRQAVRCAGIDIGVHRSDRRSRLGKLTRQGSPELRWALYEAAQSATRPRSPDNAEYLRLKRRGKTHTQASLTIARKPARRSFHILRQLGPAALELVTE